MNHFHGVAASIGFKRIKVYTQSYWNTEFCTVYMKAIRFNLYFCVTETTLSAFRLNRGRVKPTFFITRKFKKQPTYVQSSPPVCECDSRLAAALRNLFENVGHCGYPCVLLSQPHRSGAINRPYFQAFLNCAFLSLWFICPRCLWAL